MGLRDFVQLLRWNWVALVLLAAIGMGLGWLVADRTEPQYRAANTVFVSAQTGSSTSDLNAGASFIARQMKTYAEVARSPKVLQPVVDSLDLGTSAGSLRGDVSASIQGGDTQLIQISVTRPSGKEAAAIADAVADELAKAVVELSPPREDGSPSVRVTSISPAAVPGSPVVPNMPRNLALGFVVGLLAGLGYALLRTTLDTRVRTHRDVTHLLDIPILAGVVADPRLNVHRRRSGSVQRSSGVIAAPQSIRAEQYRQLRTNLQFLDATRRPRTILVTSARGGEGKSVTAVNLAAILAHSGSRVCLVDADLRRPTVAKYLGVEGHAGLTTVLIGQASLDDVLLPYGEDGLHILTSGITPPNPSELLGSSLMADVLDQLLERFDTVVIDCAPLLPVTDAAVLSRVTDGVLLTVGAGVVTREQLRDAAGRLETIGARPLGIVINRLSQRASSAGSYGYSSRPVLARTNALRALWQPRESEAAWPANLVLPATPAREHAPEPEPEPEPTADPSAAARPTSGPTPVVVDALVRVRPAGAGPLPVATSGPVPAVSPPRRAPEAEQAPTDEPDDDSIPVPVIRLGGPADEATDPADTADGEAVTAGGEPGDEAADDEPDDATEHDSAQPEDAEADATADDEADDAPSNDDEAPARDREPAKGKLAAARQDG